MEILFTFPHTRGAIRAEKALLEQQIPVSMMPLPSQLGAGCGLSLRLDEDYGAKARQLLTEADIPWENIYRLLRDAEKISYVAQD